MTWLEFHQYIDVAVRSKIVAECRAEQRQPRDTVPLAECPDGVAVDDQVWAHAVHHTAVDRHVPLVLTAGSLGHGQGRTAGPPQSQILFPECGGMLRLTDQGGRPPMPHARSQKRKKTPKRVLALPDLEHAKSAVLSSLTSRSGQRTYDHAIREFVAWSCSEPRLACNRTVVLRYRIDLEQRQSAPATINLRLAAVRRVAYEAADARLLSPELAASAA